MTEEHKAKLAAGRAAKRNAAAAILGVSQSESAKEAESIAKEEANVSEGVTLTIAQPIQTSALKGEVALPRAGTRSTVSPEELAAAIKAVRAEIANGKKNPNAVIEHTLILRAGVSVGSEAYKHGVYVVKESPDTYGRPTVTLHGTLATIMAFADTCAASDLEAEKAKRKVG